MSTGYQNESAYWKLRKVARYTRLYGPRRTAIKVRAQRHMAASGVAWSGRYENPACQNPDTGDRAVAIVGCGNFAFSNIAYYAQKALPDFLRATYDLQPNRARSLCDIYGGAYATTDFEDILRDEAIRFVFISSNHATHASYASAAIRAGKAVHIEKPHAVTSEQLEDLEKAMREQPEVPVFLGFNRPRSSHHQRALALAANEPGPFLISWFIAGHQIPDDHWYYAKSEGGRVLGNLCHWLDSTLQMIGQEGYFPCSLIPSSRPESKSDYALTIDCANGSLVSLNFSAKGHTFEGVREVMSLHRGDALVLLRDFEETRLQKGATKHVHRTLFRDHGHRANILNSLQEGLRRSPSTGEDVAYVMDSGRLALAARVALESGETVTLDAWQQWTLHSERS